MIGEAWWFWAMGGLPTPGGSGCWHVGDWDQRRMISVTFDSDAEDEDLAIGTLIPHVCNSPTPLEKRWDEMNMWICLSPHPHIVPFDRIVVKGLYGQEHIVGCTTEHIAGGSP